MVGDVVMFQCEQGYSLQVRSMHVVNLTSVHDMTLYEYGNRHDRRIADSCRFYMALCAVLYDLEVLTCLFSSREMPISLACLDR